MPYLVVEYLFFAGADSSPRVRVPAALLCCHLSRAGPGRPGLAGVGGGNEEQALSFLSDVGNEARPARTTRSDDDDGTMRTKKQDTAARPTLREEANEHTTAAKDS